MLNVSRNGFGAEGNIALIDALVVCDFAEDNAYRLTAFTFYFKPCHARVVFAEVVNVMVCQRAPYRNGFQFFLFKHGRSGANTFFALV